MELQNHPLRRQPTLSLLNFYFSSSSSSSSKQATMNVGGIKFGQVGEVVTTNDSTDASQSHTNNTTPANPPTNEFAAFITPHKLNGENYVQWSQSLLIHLAHKDKEGHINGDLPAPAQTEATYKSWKINDNLVKSWLINTMEKNIGELYLLHKTAKDIWDNVDDAYSNTDNTAEIMEIETRLYNLKQDNMTVSEYHNTLANLWLQMDMYRSPKWTCTADAAVYRNLLDQTRTVRFLLGLNKDLDDVRGRIMATSPLPDLRKAFAQVRRESSRRRIMLPEQLKPTNEGSALVARNAPKSNKYCDNCRRHDHIREECWGLHGRPSDQQTQVSQPKGKGKPPKRGNLAEKGEESSNNSSSQEAFSKGQIEILEKMFTKFATSSTEKSVNLAANQGTLSRANGTRIQDDSMWILDSGCTDHMTGNLNLLWDIQPYPKNSGVQIAYGTLAPIQGVGKVKVSPSMTLFPVLFVPKLNCNLMSVSQLTRDLKCEVVFGDGICEFQDSTLGKMIGRADLVEGLYVLKGAASSYKAALSSQISSTDDKVLLWHSRLGHPSFGYLERLFPSLFTNKRSIQYTCEVCQYAKHTRSVYSQVPYTATALFSIIHSDIWGPCRVTALSGARWFITMIDEHTRMTWTFLMKDKSETAGVFQSFYSMVKTQFHTQIKVLKTDNAKDYFNSHLGSFLTTQGIIHSSSCVDTPEQNGIAERKNRQLLETARAMMFTTNTPKYLWGEALLTATYLINRLPSRPLNYKVPRQVLLDAYPHIHAFSGNLNLKVFGCTAFVHLYAHQRSKLNPRSVKCVFIGYSAHKKAYNCYSPHTKRFYHTMDVTFFEHEAYFPRPTIQGENTVPEATIQGGHIAPNTPKQPRSQLELLLWDITPAVAPDRPDVGVVAAPTNTSSLEGRPPIVQTYHRRTRVRDAEGGHPTGQEDVVEMIPEPNAEILVESTVDTEDVHTTTDEGDLYLPIAYRKGVRECTKHPINRYVSYSRLSPNYKAFLADLDTVKIPKNIEEALSDPKWRKAVECELQALQKNETWSIVQLLKRKKGS